MACATHCVCVGMAVGAARVRDMLLDGDVEGGESSERVVLEGEGRKKM